jgi:hypothetical protein
MNIRRPEGHLGHSSILLWFSFVYIRGYATPRHATVTLAVSQHSGRERERNKEDEERAEAGERAQGLKASPRNPRPRLASRSLPLLRWPPLPSPCDSIQDG